MSEALGIDIVVGMEGIGLYPSLIFCIVEMSSIQTSVAHQYALESLEITISILTNTHHSVAIA